MTRRPCKLCEGEILLVRGPNDKPMCFDAKPRIAWYIDEQSGEARPYKAYVPHQASCGPYKERRDAARLRQADEHESAPADR